MKTEIGQVLSIIAHGNAFLLQNYDLNKYFPNNDIFNFCNSVKFISIKKNFFGRQYHETVGNSPLEWLQHQKRKGCKRLAYQYESCREEQFPDYILTAFANSGGNSLIKCYYYKNCELWLGRWEVTDKDHPERRIWSVTYYRVGTDNCERELVDIEASKVNLKGILQEIELFARKHNINDFAETFNKAIKTLDSDKPSTYWNLTPDIGYTIQAKQLLYGACNAWVFGGMGSWNDWTPDDDKETYTYLTEQLYYVVIESLGVAINSYMG